MIRKLAILLIVASAFLFLFAESIIAEFAGTANYPKGKLFTSNGDIIGGKNLIIKPNSVSLDIGDLTKTYQLSEVQQIMVKGRLARKFALGCGGISLIYQLGNGLWYGINLDEIPLDIIGIGFAVVIGGTIGTLMDDWKPVYFAPRGAYRSEPSHLGMEMSQSKTCRLVFSYRF